MNGRSPHWAKKLSLGLVTAAVFAVGLLLAVELGLRLFGYGHAPGFWRIEKSADGRRWIRENPWVTAPFFAPELVRRPQPFRLPERKPEDAYRVFVLGSSAAMGDPEPSFSMARLLETMLRAAYPKIHFEVVNAAVTAINSHVVRGIAEDCAKLQPDLFVVYEGNNEVIGPFGPATVFTPVLRKPAAIRAAVFLRGLRTGQALTQLARRSSEQRELADWGGMQMFLNHQIAAGDPRLDSTVSLFEDNLRAISKAGRSAGATVLLATVLTNQKDFSPFASGHRTGLSPDIEAEFDRAEARGDAAANGKNWAEAERAYRAALGADGEYAETHFRLGRVFEAERRFTDAKTEFQQALDLDLLRFRTDSRLNEAIRRVALSTGDGVELVDLVKAGEAESPGGILGDELLYEHVHLSFRGAYIVARELFRAATEDLKRRGRITPTEAVAEPMSMDELRLRLAFTTYEQAMITKELLARFRRPPFTGQSSNPRRIAVFAQRDARAAELLALPESRQAISAIYEQALAANPGDWVLARNYGLALAANGQGAKAKPELLRALNVIPDDSDTLFGLILAHRQLGETDEMEKRIRELRRIEPRYPGLETLK
ncbi:hypothetical protein DB347_14565 [Opitutaceae bacterium EW11]|nr:hypothetical protein DB347_14565 [Opitutaceae bacterium EW11]